MRTPPACRVGTLHLGEPAPFAGLAAHNNNILLCVGKVDARNAYRLVPHPNMSQVSGTPIDSIEADVMLGKGSSSVY